MELPRQQQRTHWQRTEEGTLDRLCTTNAVLPLPVCTIAGTASAYLGHAIQVGETVGQFMGRRPPSSLDSDKLEIFMVANEAQVIDAISKWNESG